MKDPNDAEELERIETREWLDSLDYVLESGGPERVGRLMKKLRVRAEKSGVKIPYVANTPYIDRKSVV